MSQLSELYGLRIGCVRYLNSRPLIHAYPGKVIFDHPSKLASMLASGELDLALIPIYEVIRTPEYRVVDQVAIASLGPVYSVFLAYTGELSAVTRIERDPASMTSVNLLQVLLAEFHGIRAELHDPNGANGSPLISQARLLIGNQAIDFRKVHGDQFQYLDLGAEWTLQTGLPFVFAAWALRPGLSAGVAEAIRSLKAASMAQLEEIIAGEEDPEFARDYLTHKIRFDLGAPEKQAIARFAGLLAKHGLSKKSPGLTYV